MLQEGLGNRGSYPRNCRRWFPEAYGLFVEALTSTRNQHEPVTCDYRQYLLIDNVLGQVRAYSTI